MGIFPDVCQKESGANAVRKAHDVKSQGHAGTWERWWEEDCASYKGPAGGVFTALAEVATIKSVLLPSREQQEQLGGTVTYFSTQSR